MRIYRIRCDVNAFQSFYIDKARWHGDLLAMLTFECSPRAAAYSPPPVFVLHPKLKAGNFYYLCPGALVVDSTALDHLQDLLEMSGEMLRLPYKDCLFHLLNVTECINVLDERHAKRRSSGTIEKYAFHPERLTETPLFKIPETCRAEILTCEGLKDPEDEFKGRVEQLGLKGLIFEELWSDEA